MTPITSSSLRLGVWFPGGHSPRDMARLAARAEATGIDSVWVAEGPLGRDAFVGLSAIAAATERVALGTAIANPYIRHPAQLASAFGTLDELSGGRVICGIGVGARDQLMTLGYDVSRPLRAARESIAMVRALLARETVDVEGEKFTARGARMGFRLPRPEIPIFLAATGPKMCALAGEIADGIYLPYGTPQFLERTIAQSRERRSDDRPFEVACQALVSVDDDPDAAKARVRPGIGFILTEPNGEDVLRGNGVDPAHAERIRSALRTGGVRAMAAAVADEVLDHLTICGSQEHCRARLAEMADLGVTHITASIVDDEPGPVLDLLSSVQKAGTRA